MRLASWDAATTPLDSASSRTRAASAAAYRIDLDGGAIFKLLSV